MDKKLVATIDCGSSNVRCIIFDMETGEQVKVSLKEAVVRIQAGLAAKNQGKVICDRV